MHYCIPASPSRPDREHFARYARAMLLDLQDMATVYRMDMLVYLIEMAALEATVEMERHAAPKTPNDPPEEESTA